jgi:hypothetical protein
MVVLHIAQTLPINPPGANPAISAAQAWAGLKRKAYEPQYFVPVVESCRLLGDEGNKVSLEVRFRQDVLTGHKATLRETCTLSAPCRLDYAIEDGSSAVNVISRGGRGSGGDDDLMLTFVFAWNHEGVEEGSAEAQELLDQHWKVSF